MVTKVHGISIYMGLSTDEKPVVNVFNGDVFDELDTGVKYRFDEGNSEWLAQPTGGGGGGGDDGGDKPWSELTWEQVIASTKTGKYKTFTVGDMKELDLGTEGIVHMQIVGIDADDLADGSGKAPLTFIGKELLATKHRMNPARTPSSAPYDEGTGAIGGWEKCEMRTYLKETVKQFIPENVRTAIRNVTKYSNSRNTSGAQVLNSVTTDDVWIPSNREIFAGTNCETVGPAYSSVFTDDDSRKKYVVGASSATYWWLRTAKDEGPFYRVSSSGAENSAAPTSTVGVALGFCL